MAFLDNLEAYMDLDGFLDFKEEVDQEPDHV
jgi:hypothetical protein